MTEQPMPESPQHAENPSGASQQASSRGKRPRRAQLIIASITVGLLLLVAGNTALSWSSAPTGASADIPTDWSSDWLDGQDRSLNSFTVAWEKDMNEALQSGDKDLFLANAEGNAKEMLGFWWDGTREIGWDYAFAGYGRDFDGIEYLDLGMKLGFAAQPVRSSGSPDAGLDLTQMFVYELTLEGEGDDAILTDLVPRQPMPWDEGPIYVQKRDQVVLFAAEDERALVDATIDIAQEAAADTFALIEQIGGEAPTEGFTAAITDDQAMFDRWPGSHEGLQEMEIAGFAASTSRPGQRTEFMPPEIATGSYSSGTWVGMGPKSADRRKAVFVHEFAHAVHESALPYDYYAYLDLGPVEGFAQYVEELVSGGGVYEMDPRAKEFILANGEYAISKETLRSADAYLGYWAASSYFHFVEAAGGSAWQIAMDRDEGLTMSQRAKMQGPEFGTEDWLDWVTQQ